MRAYKYLTAAGRGRFSDVAWPRPNDGRPGEWLEAALPLGDCLGGIHACAPADLLDWIDDELWEIELGGEVVRGEGLLVAERGRLVRRVDLWNAASARAFTETCAWRAREQAFAALREVGLTAEAEALVVAAELSQLQRAAAAVGQGDGPGADVAALAADVVSLAQGQRPDAWMNEAVDDLDASSAATAANVAFVVAHVVGRRAAAAGADYGAAFAAERAWQLNQLTGRLELDEPSSSS